MNHYGTRNKESLETRSSAESVIQRVYQAVEQLCTGKGNVRERLIPVVTALVFLRVEDFPEELREDFEWVISESTKFHSEMPKYRGDIEETMRRIRNSTGEKIAQRIFKLYSRLQEIRGFPLLEYRNPND